VAITSLSFLFLLVLLPAARLLAQSPNVLTWRYDNTHQGQNTQETILTPTNVNANTFGKLFSQSVDGEVYAQPLYVANLTVNGATHNVIFVADEHDSVYAFDADSNGGTNSAPLWQASMISTAHGAAAAATTVPYTDVQSGVGDIHPEIGITSTPVIDATTQTIFLVAKSKENGNYVQRLHALNIVNGSERSGSPVVLTASVPGNGNGSSGGTLTFSTLWENNRPALGLFNGNVYIGFAAHGDNGPWHGWVLVYNETTLNQTAAMCTSPNGDGDGIWSSGAGFPIDTVSANGRLFLVTGNGDLSSYPPLSNNVDFGESILRYDLSNSGIAVTDAFTSFNQAALTGSDLDQGGGGVLILPDQPGTYPHLLVQVGKEGRILVLNRDKLNGYAGPNAGSNTNAVQDITGALASGLWSTPAYWNENVYMWASDDTLKMFPLTNGVLATRSSVQSSATSGFPGASPVISSNGTQNGILWALRTDQYNSNGSAVLYAFNATNPAQEYYDSGQNSDRDDAGQAVKFQVPVVTNGKVYVGGGTQVDVYGLLNQQHQAPAPIIAPSGGSYGAAQQITMTDSLGGAAIYYTTDGSTPTTASKNYSSGGFELSTDSTVQAIANASGYLQSAVSSATYNFNTQTSMPQFSPAAGTYTTTQSVSISDGTSGAVIYYTTDGSTPTASSKKYTGPITVSASTVINAIATDSGLTNSNLASATYTIQANGTEINYGSGFASVVGLTLNGSATSVDDSRLQLTTGLTYQASTVFYNTPTNIQAFTTDFAFQLSDAEADGFTFTIQNVGPTAIGGYGGSLGYGPNPTTGTTGGIAKSVAIKFDFYNNAGEGTDSTGLYVDGASPTVPAVDMTSSGVLLNSGDSITAHMTYDGVNLAMTLTDIVVNKTFTHTFAINIPSTIGSNLAYIGFTGGSGGESSSQKILSWTFTSQSGSVTQTPAFSPAGGTFATAQQVTLSDGTAGAVIYYTIDGSVPTTSSHVYSSPISVASGMVTINAMAQTPGYSASSVGSATYSIQSTEPAAGTPTFSPGTGTYTSTQSVTIGEINPGATIYYTTDGTVPTTSSAVYNSAITVSANATLEAIAVAPLYTQSAVATAGYVIQSSGTGTIDFASGFPSATGLQLNGPAKVNSSNFVELTDGGGYEASSAFWTTPMNVQAFTTNFTFQLTSAVADGFTFTIQNAGTAALGAYGGGLGYGVNPNGGTTGGIGKSVAVKFDIYSNAGEGNDSTGVFTDGASPTNPAINLTSSGIVLSSGDAMSAQRVYDGTTLTLNLTDTVTNKTFSQAFTIDIPSTVGANTAYVGFTGGTGGSTAIQNIKSWAFSSSTTQTAADPVFSPLPGTYTTAQNVTLTSATPGATIYYTADGSTPTTSSPTYRSAIVVNGVSLTIRAFAAATSYQSSPIVVGTYQIQAPATVATPTISPTSGTTFSSTLSVSIADASANATIYYTTDGSTPTTNSTKYGGAFSISSSEVINAIATYSGLTNSTVATASYTLVPAATEINYGSGFPNAAGLQVNGSAKVNSGNLELTDGGGYEAGSAFWTTPVNIQAFTTNFTFQLASAVADGFTFTIQDAGTTALGAYGGGLGYGVNPNGGTGARIGSSVAIKFDIYSNAGEGNDSTGVFTDGASPTNPAINLTSSGIVLASGDTIAAQLVYNGAALTLNLTDTVTNKTFSQAVTINIPSTVGANTAYVGFTGGTGGATAIQNIKTWTFSSGTP
jgi:ribonuclease HI